MKQRSQTGFRNGKAVCVISAGILLVTPLPVYGDWKGNHDSGWQYEENGECKRNAWHWDGTWWYHLGTDGCMDTGWYEENGVWYYLYPEEGKPQGSAASGWVKVNGLWHYFHPFHDGRFGAMAVSMIVDGYPVGADGSWNGKYVSCFSGPGEDVAPSWEREEGNSDSGGNAGGTNGSSSGGSGGGTGNSGSSSGGSDNGETAPGDGSTEPDGESRLREWEEKAAAAEQAYLGEDWGMGHDWIVTGQEENDKRVAQMVSRLTDEEWHEFYLIGLDFIPDTRCFSRYPDILYSRLEEDTFQTDGKTCHVVRVRFCRQGEEEGDKEPLPPDEDRIWEAGDVQERELAGETYRFRCVDGEYEADGETFALFLCEEVIPSDVDSDEFERRFLTFGKDSNYKTSDIREWLGQNGTDREGIGAVNVGVDTAYTGSTEEGTFGEADPDLLRPEDIGSQRIVERYFCLSLEEALRYGEALWSFEGKADNPESQTEPYSLGYWLRTPVYGEEDGRFCYGDQAYMVDLELGNLRPADTEDETVGIRPAYAVPQKGKMGETG